MSGFAVFDGDEVKPIKVVHWWPGREYAGPSPIPPFIIKEAKRRGSRYLTRASVTLDNFDFSELAFCNPVDMPSRERGHMIALGRLLKHLAESGYIIVPRG